MSAAMEGCLSGASSSSWLRPGVQPCSGDMTRSRLPTTRIGQSARASGVQRTFQSGCAMRGGDSELRFELPFRLVDRFDEDGSALPVEPALDTVAHMGRTINPGVFVVRNAMFVSSLIAHQVRASFEDLDLPH